MAIPPLSIKINGVKELEKAFKKYPVIATKEIQKAISLSTFLVQRNTRKEAPVKTGHLRRRILQSVGSLIGRVESTVNYGNFIHEGTKPHIIRPVRKKALFWKGAQHPVKLVRHPGTKANPFMKRGIKKSEREVSTIFQKALNNITTQLAK